MTARIPYRPEVDGLRAVAIVAVILYHLDIGAFSGGFVGVDVFFVISGYLIFSLLYHERTTTGGIDWRAFYARRITRLLPEATVLIMIVVVIGYFILLPTGPTDGEGLRFRRLQLTQSGAAGSLWLANFHYWQFGSGYFAPWSGREPLIHLWSLGVEEQFYLAVPALFWIASALTRMTNVRWVNWATALLAMASVVSLVLAVIYAGKWSAFYLLPTRAYEFAVGAALALWTAQTRRAISAAASSALVVLGMCGIAASIAWLRNENFPGAWALLPTLSAACVVLGSVQPSLIKYVLTLPPMVYIGKISYGWYLWHWPLLVLWREYALYNAPPWSEAATAVVALFPAAIGYHWVAKLRRHAGSPGVRTARVFGAGALATMLSLTICGAFRWAADLSPITPELSTLNSRMHDGLPKTGECLKERFEAEHRLSACPFGALEGEVTVVLWGDSHAAAWLPGFDALLKERGVKGEKRILFACPPGFVQDHPTSNKFDDCNLFNERVIDELVVRSGRESLVVILAGRWAGYVNPGPLAVPDRGTMPPGWAPGRRLLEMDMADAIAKLKNHRVPVGITQSVPEMRYSVPVCLYRWPSDRCGVSWVTQEAYLRPSIEMITALSVSGNLPVLDPVPWLCTEELCRVAVGDLVLYWDDDHLSESAMEYLRQPMAQFVDALLQQRQAVQPTPASPQPR